MARKGLDSTFVHYGVRRTDMALIEGLCAAHGLDADWVKEHLLREWHEAKIRNQDLDEKGMERVIEKALQKV